MAVQPGFFDLSDRCEALSTAGDPLERLSAVVDFELFRGPLAAALRRGPCNQGDRPAIRVLRYRAQQKPYRHRSDSWADPRLGCECRQYP